MKTTNAARPQIGMKMDTVSIPREDLEALLLLAADPMPESCFYPMRVERPDLFSVFKNRFVPDAARASRTTTTDQRCIENALDALGYIIH